MHISRKNTLEQYNQAFLNAKSTLNDKQRSAVDEIYGPVMTVAGPGTGKTQLLAVRIGNILQQTDVNISNIICLTFTDSGALAMRDRLKKFIGPEAYNANIFTYHSFCSYVIQENIQYFGGYRNLQNVTDLELVDIFREIIDGFAVDNPLKRLKGNLYFDAKRLKTLFNIMKQEGWSAEEIEKQVFALREYYTAVDETGEYINDKYLVKGKQTGKLTGTVYTKGQINLDKIELEIEGFAGLIAGAKELENYNKLLEKQERYDYNDMILWVIEAFKENDELLAKYQERFQFLLMDEYQDTNGSQNELIFLLADNPVDDKPNIFIVGDDDQSIYRFQGANMNNIIDFADKYAPKEIVLDNNYRSQQAILDWSKLLIDNNGERLVSLRPHLTKNLIESRTPVNNSLLPPQVIRYQTIAQEELGIVKDILAKHKSGVPYKEMAVLYRNHKDAENMVKYLSQEGVPLNIKKKVNILNEGEIKRLILVLKYIMTEFKKPFTGDKFLFELMHLNYYGITAMDAALLSIYCSKRTDEQEDDRRWRIVLSSRSALEEAKVTNIEAILKFSEALEGWIKDIPNVTAQVLFEKILTQGGVLDDILGSSDKVWRLQMVNTFFNFIKEESSRGNNLSMPDIIDMLDKMEENEIVMPLTKVIYSDEGIHFMTTHGSKGLEFDHVYIMKADDKKWVTKSTGGNRSFTFPNSLVPVSSLSDVEDDRRLFYVAMTRARDYLTISFSDFDDNEKALEPVRFISEITTKEEDVKKVLLEEEEVLKYKADLMRYSEGEVQLIEHDLIDNILQSFRVSATSLNKYLRCPITFYFENILRVPMARTAANGFGNAIHYALEMYFRDMEADPERKVPTSEILVNHFKVGMKKFHSHFTPKERELSEIRGEKLLQEYYDTYQQSWSLPRKFELEFDIKTEFNGVPISGKLDQIAVYDDHLQVIDYKTGKYDPPKLKGPNGDDDPGGDYWRQIVFYKMLLRGDDRLRQPMRTGVMDFVEAQKNGKFQKKQFEVEDFEIDFVGKQLSETYASIKNHEFQKGCGDEKCKWCNFVKENMPVDGE